MRRRACDVGAKDEEPPPPDLICTLTYFERGGTGGREERGSKVAAQELENEG